MLSTSFWYCSSFSLYEGPALGGFYSWPRFPQSDRGRWWPSVGSPSRWISSKYRPNPRRWARLRRFYRTFDHKVADESGVLQEYVEDFLVDFLIPFEVLHDELRIVRFLIDFVADHLSDADELIPQIGRNLGNQPCVTYCGTFALRSSEESRLRCIFCSLFPPRECCKLDSHCYPLMCYY